MTIDKEKLKELAEAANAVTTDVNITMAVGADPEEVKAVQDYLQQTMPKTILALLAEIEMLSAQRLMHLRLNLSLRARRKVWVAHCEKAEDQLLDVQSERDQLKAENEALRKDAERYRWLRQASATDGEYTHGVCIDLWENGCGFEVTLEEADAAVDAAMTTGARP